MALRAVSPHPRLLGFVLPLALLTIPGSDGVRRFDCSAGSHVVGRAAALAPGEDLGLADWDRLDRLTEVARNCEIRADDWRLVARRLETEGRRVLGRLTMTDAYWLGTAWWAFHQPSRHLHYPAWAPKSVLDPNVALRHAEGGNCESSANGHAALLAFLGVPSRTVYGHLLPSGEGHVWTISDVDGVPMAADVHVARPDEETRRFGLPWRPSPAQIQTTASYAEALRFAVLHRPENPNLDPLNL
jgi:hypothetical protein